MTFDASILGADAAERWTQMLKGMRATLSAESASNAQNLGQWICFGRPIAISERRIPTAPWWRWSVGREHGRCGDLSQDAYGRAGAALTGEKTHIPIHFETLPPTGGRLRSVTATTRKTFHRQPHRPLLAGNDRSRHRLNE